MIEKISGIIGIGLVIGNKTIGILFGRNSDVISIIVLIVGVLLLLVAIIKYEKKRNIEIDDYKSYREDKIKLLEGIAKQGTLESCISILENNIKEVYLNNKDVSSKLEKVCENIITLRDIHNAKASDFKILIKDEITSKIVDLRSEVSQKLAAVCESNEKYGWIDSDRKALLELEKIQ